jgi:AcrR family transcriptional regulator
MQLLHRSAFQVYGRRVSSSPERRRLAARRALSHAAIALAAERGGLDTVSVDDIADAGDVSRRTFFNYFPTKGDAIAWPLAAFHDRLLATLAARPPAEPIWAALEASAAAALTDRATDLGDLAGAGRLIGGSPEVLGTRSGAESVPAIAQQIAARTGTDPRADVYPALTAGSAGTGIRLAVQRWAEHGGPVGDHLAEVFALIRGGLPDPRFVIDQADVARNSDGDGGSDSVRFSGPFHPGGVV